MNSESQILNVPIEDIIPNRFQPRLNFDESALKELSASIKEHGIIQPLVLRPLGEKYEIIAGERRYKAAKMAGLTFVPAIISMLDDKKSAEVAIVENVQRRDLSSIEEAKSYKALLDKGYLTQEELAKKMGLSQSAISNKLRLLSLSEVVQNALMEGKISERHARSLLQIDNHDEQINWLNKIIEERLTVKDLDNKIKSMKPKEDEKIDDDVPIVALTPNIEEIKEKAEDIVVNQDIIDVIPQSTVESTKPIPNKFFNYLEDEQANMNMFEPTIINQTLEEPDDKNINEDNKVNDDNEGIEVNEEIELLDFDVPSVVEEVKVEDVITVPLTKDMDIANGLVDKLVSDLKMMEYNVKTEKDDLTNEIKYIITIDKN